jgi:predicted enzyme related to lactoylglutathione lyase
MKSEGIFLTWIAVSDVEEAIKFYTEVVGLELKEFYKEFNWAELAGKDGSRLGIAQSSPELQAGSNAVPTVAVKDIESVRADFQKKGVELIGEIMEIPGHVKLQSFKDKDGNFFQLVEVLSFSH